MGKRPGEAAGLPKEGGDPSKRVTSGNALPGPMGGGAYVKSSLVRAELSNSCIRQSLAKTHCGA